MTHVASVVLGIVLALSTLAGTQSKPTVSTNDPLLGTWHLDRSKSTYRPGPAPRSQTRIYEKHQFGIKATVKTIFTDGRSTTVQSIYEFGKEEYPVTGSEEVDAIIVTRVSPYTHEATLSHAGQVIGSFRRVISNDGKEMTVTLKRSTPPADNVEVYEKEPDNQQ